MNKLFKDFANGNAKVTSKDANIGVSVEFHGNLTIVKGGLSQDIDFYANTSATMYKGFISLDVWDINDTTATSFNGMPIDDLRKLKTTLTESGLSTVAKTLDINRKETSVQIATQIQNCKLFKTLHGKAARMLETLSEEETVILRLNYAIDNYKTLNVNSFVLKGYIVETTVGEEGEETIEKSIPSIESLQLELLKLTKK